ncbi:MAG: plasmid pRiA4b ORF-3 family protein [Treponema sp.]|jgi:hypothetical protein|nr:plasmid pRiA4b ORF-3 family protein [Treponema sp.]
MTKQEQLEKDLEDFMLNQSGAFQLTDMMHALPGKKTISKQGLIEILRDHPLVFSRDFETCMPRHVYFQDARFLVSPREEEIAQGILIPGHRFLPFYASDRILPWNCTLITGEQAEVPRKMARQSLKSLQVYFTLFGPGSVVPMLYQDQAHSSPAPALSLVDNGRIDNSRISTIRVDNNLVRTSGIYEDTPFDLTVFDCADLYQAWQVTAGDSLLLEVKDWLKGIFTVSFMARARQQELMMWSGGWIKKLEQGFRETFNTFNLQKSIEEQIAYAYYFAGKELLQEPPIHVGGFLDVSDKVYLISFGIEGKLWHEQEIDTSQLLQMIDKTPVKKAEGFNGFLESLSVPCSEVEIEAFMRDELFRHKGEFTGDAEGEYSDPVLERLLGKDIDYFSRVQQKTLYKYCTKLWTKVFKSYNFFQDQAAGKVRAGLLGILEEYFAWLRNMGKMQVNPEDIPMQIMAGLGQCVVTLTGFLKRLNTYDGATPQEIAVLYEMLPQITETMESLKEKALEHLKTNMPRPGNSGLRLVRAQDDQDTVSDDDDEEDDEEPESIFVLRISIKGISPQIWRSVQVPGSFTLGDLHQIIQLVMGWDDEHLHRFEIQGMGYGPVLDEEEAGGFGVDEDEDEEDYMLDELDLVPKQRFRYTYDFGDNWEHQILVSKILLASAVSEEDRIFPRCLNGKRACPPEDCGGVWGYEELLEALKAPKKKKNRELLEWLEDFNPEYFDVDEVNALFHPDLLGGANDDDDEDDD